MRYNTLLIALLLISCSDNHIIQRSSEDYFPLRAGDWWRYASTDDTVLVEVEAVDTLLLVECYPVSYDGVARYLAKYDESISQYISVIYNYAGNDHTVLENFLVRIELPLVKGNAYQYSLADSITVANQLIKGQYEIIGLVVDYAYESDYGDVYEINITTVESLTTPDTSIVDTTDIIEYYAPGLGMIRFQDTAGEYHLIEYNTP
ncbi:hypothetical protein KAS45_05405 [candidate division WOR-3 bacterium]|nr:hypothetical protein [candidate division WOR-3 bacterium]